ncbi:isoprenylcysteine carboxylmethyltransferase family protein [Evansella sp. AB-P1]|uniref:isoprenylcysteine carboxyl methyltransferase family protein n=1 Tax=Evansella sp. AB-P1 TaxID=3037653 RepID=UPI00241D48DD|nr:isoprenylcysteine carboxylmethyltransferase family protein [Evansella sp. AB-P1]MDG5785921.1 isoprenylcysteine carboxylmethyltransferase family protein [Evansella sp. AB-P1]
MTIFWIVLSIVALQRIIELVIAKRNERWLKNQGGKEFGEDHYRWIVLLHISFLLFFSVEVWLKGGELFTYWLFILGIFIIVQLGRVWVISSLGRYWNTKILIVPGTELVERGPYKWIKHPNYWIVAIEIFILPLMFQAYITMVVFTILNAFVLLFIRIPQEERALNLLMERQEA